MPRPVSIRVADARLLAPNAVRRVALLGSLDGWREALDGIGVAVVEEAPDLVVATPALVDEAIVLDAPTVIVLGLRRRSLRRAGYTTRTLLTRPGREAPRLFVPVDARAASAHALLARLPGRGSGKRFLVRLTIAALRVGLPLPGSITLATRDPAPPRLLAGAACGGSTPGADWYLVTGVGDDLQRIIWFSFPDKEPDPRWVVKCSRVPGYSQPFDREEEALQALDSLPPTLRGHAPRLVCRFEVDGHAAAVETAGTGQPLHTVLPEARHADAREIIDAIADWIVVVGHATILPPDELEPELARLENEVVLPWTAVGAPMDLVSNLPRVAPVLQHNDLGCWNIVVRDGRFTVVDWESTRRAGLPLWDLIYFLTDALSWRVAAGRDDSKEQAVLALLRGELELSTVLFGRLRLAADAFSVPYDAVGPIVTLAWLQHGLSAEARARRGALHGAATGSVSETGPLQRVARPWLSDPALGVGWPAFRASLT
jgi:hypothetical protein